jgi:hypothetical protein
VVIQRADDQVPDRGAIDPLRSRTRRACLPFGQR